MPLRLRIHIVLLCLCWLNASKAQLYQSSKAITIAEGLSDNRITAFWKDPTGYVWIGTQNGLNCYAGQRIIQFLPNASNAISNEYINDISGDGAGNIWVATRNGLNRFTPATGEWKKWQPLQPDTKCDLPNSLVWDVHFDKKGTLWLATDVFEFCSLAPAADTFVYYNWPAFVQTISGRVTSPGYHSIQRFVQKTEHEFWLGSNKGLVHLNTNTKKFTYIGGGYNADVLDIQWDAERQEVLLSVKGGLFFVYNVASSVYKQVATTPDAYPSVQLPENQFASAWMMAGDEGLIKRGKNGKGFSVMRHISGISASLPAGGVTRAYADDAGLIWVGTPNGAVVYDTANPVAAFLPLLPAKQTEASNRMSSVYYSQQEGLYFVGATNPAALFIVDKRNDGKIERLSKDAAGNPISACLMIKQAGKNIWVLTETSAYIFNVNTKSLELFKNPYNGSLTGFRDVAVDADGKIWLATFHKGVFCYNPLSQAFEKPTGNRANYLNDVATALFWQRQDSTLWMGSFGRYLHALTWHNNTLTGYDELSGVSRYQFLNMINDIDEDADGQLWIATHTGGIFKQQRGETYNQAFTQYTMRNGLGQHHYLSVAAGPNNWLWLLSGNGVSYIQTRDSNISEQTLQPVVHFSNYGSDPTVPHKIHYNTTTNELLVAAGGGLLLYRPLLQKNIPAFSILVNVNQQQDTNIASANADTFSFPHYQSDIRLRIDGLYFGLAPVTYQYQLEGYDKKWRTNEAGMEAYYQHLPPGEYRFRVQALDNKGKLICESQPLTLQIQFPFWQQWWFLLLALVLAGVGLYALVRYLVQRFDDERILRRFATSLYGKNSIEEICWQTARSGIAMLGFDDCVVYQYNSHKQVLVQVAAAGPKSPGQGRNISNAISLPLGSGIVGAAAKLGKPVCVADTSKDVRYIIDDASRKSELAVPVFINEKLFGVIDSEHVRKGFFTKRHQQLLQRMAAIVAEKVAKYQTEERLRSNIARDLHDEMGSTLTSINILSKVAMSSDRPSVEVQQYLQKIKDHSANMMESMSDIVWAINPANDSLEKMILHMREFAAEMLEPAGIQFYLNVRGPVEKWMLNAEERKDLYLIFKEAVNNAVKYSDASELLINLYVDDDELTLRITDNGKGFLQAAVKQGNGLKNMQVRAAAIGAMLSIESIVGTGTAIVVKKPIT